MSDYERAMFSEATLDAIKVEPDRTNLFWRLVLKVRRWIGRDKYYVAVDPAAPQGDVSGWCVGRKDVVTGIITIVDAGQGDVPHKWAKFEGKK